MSHVVRLESVDAWSWRSFCSCGYRSMHWDTPEEAMAAGDAHLDRVRRADQPRAEHRTRVQPRRYV